MDRPAGFSWKYIGVLALAASLILSLGWLVRPRENANSQAPIQSETELAQLARRAERRSLDSMTSYFAGTAAEVDTSIVGLPGNGTSGVVWDQDTIVTTPLDQFEPVTVAVPVASVEDHAQPMVWGPQLPLAAVTPSRGLTGLTPANRARVPPEPGTWVFAFWRAGYERGFAPGSYLQSTSVTCGVTQVQEVVSSLSLSRLMAGGGLFDIDGQLLAIILPCNNRYVAIAETSIDALLERGNTDEQRMLAHFGMLLGALSEDELAHFRVKHGVIVRELLAGQRSEEAGLQAGDIIVELNGEAVGTPTDLATMARPDGDAAFELNVQRGARMLTVVLGAKGETDRSAVQSPSGAGLVLESPPQFYRIESVVPGSRAAAAGIEPGDRVVRIDHAEPRSLAQVQRALVTDGALPVLLEIARADRRIAILVR